MNVTNHPDFLYNTNSYSIIQRNLERGSIRKRRNGNLNFYEDKNFINKMLLATGIISCIAAPILYYTYKNYDVAPIPPPEPKPDDGMSLWYSIRIAAGSVIALKILWDQSVGTTANKMSSSYECPSFSCCQPNLTEEELREFEVYDYENITTKMLEEKIKSTTQNITPLILDFYKNSEAYSESQKEKIVHHITTTVDNFKQSKLQMNDEIKEYAKELSQGIKVFLSATSSDQASDFLNTLNKILNNNELEDKNDLDAVQCLKNLNENRIQINQQFVEQISLNSFFESNTEISENIVNNFSVESKFPKFLWDFIENFPTLCGEREKPNSDYLDVKVEDIINYAKHLDDILSIFENTLLLNEVINQTELLRVSNEIIDDIKRVIQETKKFKSNDKCRLTELEFTGLKLNINIIHKLEKTLKSIERLDLLEFISSLSDLTRHGENKNSCKITEGLEKLRDYINFRSLRLNEKMSKGKMGVAENIYNYCFNTLFPTGEDQETIKHLMLVDRGASGTTVASTRVKWSHYTCFMLTDKGITELDSIGSKKSNVNNFESDDKAEELVLSDAFFDRCVPPSYERMSVAVQKDNNCYLSAGWLKFCTFLEYFEQLMRMNSNDILINDFKSKITQGNKGSNYQLMDEKIISLTDETEMESSDEFSKEENYKPISKI